MSIVICYYNFYIILMAIGKEKSKYTFKHFSINLRIDLIFTEAVYADHPYEMCGEVMLEQFWTLNRGAIPFTLSQLDSARRPGV